jgi:hypothetical protein
MSFHQRYAEVFNGNHDLGKLNLVMVMQVNCPGCFLYGLPQMIQLHNQYGDKVNFSVLSTAFEDFDLNTSENTRRLVEEGYLVGETKKAMQAHNLVREQLVLPFPVLFDQIVLKEVLQQPQFIDLVIANNLHLNAMVDQSQEEMRGLLLHHFSNFEKCGYTFAANLLQGTPTFILFNDHLEIRARWFGHVNESVVIAEIEKNLGGISK